MGEELTLGIAFIAGLVSFISPCVLPLVPAYIGYMGGRVTTQAAADLKSDAKANRWETLVHGGFFVGGFTLVFVLFGVLVTAGSLIFNLQEVLVRLGGIVIILFGLQIMGQLPKFLVWVQGRTEQMNSGLGYVLAQAAHVVIGIVLAWGLGMPILSELANPPLGLTQQAVLQQAVLPFIGVALFLGWLVFGGALTRPGDFWQRTIEQIQNLLYMDTRQQISGERRGGYAGSLFMGMVFSAGWTPCIGPVYGAILTLAATGESLTTAASLLLAYSLGLGVPFLLTAFALGQAQGFLKRLQKYMGVIETVSGLFLIAIGVLLLTGELQRLSQIGSNGEFALALEHCVAFFTQNGTLVTTLAIVAVFAVLAIVVAVQLNRQLKNRGPWIALLTLALIAVGTVGITGFTFPTQDFNNCLAQGLNYDGTGTVALPGAGVDADGEAAAGNTLEDTAANDTGDAVESNFSDSDNVESIPGLDAGGDSNAGDANTDNAGSALIDTPATEAANAGADGAVTGAATGTVTEEGGLLDSLNSLDSVAVITDDSADPEAELSVGLGVGFLAPNFETMTTGGEIVRLEEFRGQTVLLNFWATWCGPCRVEMPDLQATWEALQDDDFMLLAVNRAESVNQAQEFAEEFGLTFPILMDSDERINGRIYQVQSMPTTYIIDADGVIQVRHFGFLTAEQLDGYLIDVMGEGIADQVVSEVPGR